MEEVKEEEVVVEKKKVEVVGVPAVANNTQTTNGKEKKAKKKGGKEKKPTQKQKIAEKVAPQLASVDALFSSGPGLATDMEEAAPQPRAIDQPGPKNVKEPAPPQGTVVWVWDAGAWCDGVVSAVRTGIAAKDKKDKKYRWCNVEFEGDGYCVLYPTWALELTLPTKRKQHTHTQWHALPD